MSENLRYHRVAGREVTEIGSLRVAPGTRISRYLDLLDGGRVAVVQAYRDGKYSIAFVGYANGKLALLGRVVSPMLLHAKHSRMFGTHAGQTFELCNIDRRYAELVARAGAGKAGKATGKTTKAAARPRKTKPQLELARIAPAVPAPRSRCPGPAAPSP